MNTVECRSPLGLGILGLGGATVNMLASFQRNAYWKIGDQFQTKTNVSRELREDVRDMVDIEARLAHMDETNVDIQVLFPTLFLRPITNEHDREMALARSYNRWLGDIWKRSGGRLRWVAVPPLHSLVNPGLVRAELESAKDNGACGVFMRGFECERFTNDRYFFPLFEATEHRYRSDDNLFRAGLPDFTLAPDVGISPARI